MRGGTAAEVRTRRPGLPPHSWLQKNLKLLVAYEYVDVVRGGATRTRGFYRLTASTVSSSTTGATAVRPADISMIPSSEALSSWLG